MAEIIWTDPAIVDLESIARYVAEDSLLYASRTIRKIVDGVERLAMWPRSGRMIPELHRDSIREVIVGNYRNVYLLTETRCYIVAVIHSKRDMVRALGGRIDLSN